MVAAPAPINFAPSSITVYFCFCQNNDHSWLINKNADDAHQGSVPNNLRLRILKGGPVFMVLYDDTPRPVFEGNVFGKAFVKRSLEARSIRLCS
ncbi:hypothetical protein Mapa_005139 [Marchantia paleacea]|nr:hypothetical protein Mapa_005139 [Marchantia paleacea]